MLFNLFKPKSLLGVDIGTASLKLVELRKDKGRYRLSNYGILDFGTNTDPNKRITDEEIAAGLKELVKKLKLSTKETIVSISSFNTFATVIELPYLSEKDLARAIPFEAKKYIPVPLSEVVFDWSIVNILDVQKAEAGHLPNVEVFIAAVPKDDAERAQKIVVQAGLKPQALELENVALIRGLIGNDLSPAAIINIGGRSTSILIVDKGFQRMGRNYEVGGYEITKAIARSLNVGFEKAEELKKKEGLKTEQKALSEATLPLVDMIIFETKKIMTNYENEKKIKISKIIVTGGLTNMPGFMDYLKQKTGIEVSVGNPFARIVYQDTLKPIEGELATSLSVAVGAAMRLE